MALLSPRSSSPRSGSRASARRCGAPSSPPAASARRSCARTRSPRDKIRSGAVTGSDIKNGTIKAADLAAGTIPAGLAFVVRRATKDLTALGEAQLLIPCDKGQVPVGGGGGFLSTTTTDYTGNDFYGSLINSAPANGTNAVDDRAQATGWMITARSSGGKKRLAGYVICAYTPIDEPPARRRAAEAES